MMAQRQSEALSAPASASPLPAPERVLGWRQVKLRALTSPSAFLADSTTRSTQSLAASPQLCCCPLRSCHHHLSSAQLQQSPDWPSLPPLSSSDLFSRQEPEGSCDKPSHASTPSLLSVFHWLLVLEQNPDPSPWPADPTGPAAPFSLALLPLPLPPAHELQPPWHSSCSRKDKLVSVSAAGPLHMFFLHTSEWMTSPYYSDFRLTVPSSERPSLSIVALFSSRSSRSLPPWHRPTF